MATTDNMLEVSIPASGDLSSHQFKFVLTNSSGQAALVASAGGDADGVLMNKPAAAARPAKVAVAGVAKVTVGANTVTAGDKVQADANGLADVAASGDHVLGRALTTGTTGARISILLSSSHHILA